MTSLPTVFVPDYSDLILQIRGESDDEYTALKTLHGPFGKWEHYRTALVSSLILEYRTKPAPAGAKDWTDKLLHAASHNDKRYLDFLDDGSKQGRRFYDLTVERGEQAALVNQQNSTYVNR